MTAKPISPAAALLRLEKAGLTMEEARSLTDEELLAFPTIGRRTLAHVRQSTPVPAIPPALADLRDMLEDVSQTLDWLPEIAFDDALTESEVKSAQIVLRQRLAHHAEEYHSGLRLGYVRFASIDGIVFYNLACKSWQNWKSPGALCTLAEAEAIYKATERRNQTVEQDGIKTPRGWTAFNHKKRES